MNEIKLQTALIKFVFYDLYISDISKYNYQYTGKKYVEVFSIAKQISRALTDIGLEDADLLTVDYFLWEEVLPLAERKDGEIKQQKIVSTKPITAKESKFLHEEMKEKLVVIGEFLGFESRTEVHITAGAVFDAIWEAKIGNMGKTIYVFEVQLKGSIDSLILNLNKAQNNAVVQAVIAVMDEKQLAKILKESKGVIDEKDLETWEADVVLAVYDALVRAHESINKLALVPESFYF